jgi:hypothetical protein
MRPCKFEEDYERSLGVMALSNYILYTVYSDFDRPESYLKNIWMNFNETWYKCLIL